MFRLYAWLLMACAALLLLELLASSEWVAASGITDTTNTDSNESHRAASEPAKLTTRHLPNAVQIHPRVISGGSPEGDLAFQELADLRVKTIVSVDGARPDVAAARRFGMRYVHLPHGYDEIPPARVQELAKAVRDLEGPIYIHCHHGKHRSPAAATVACVSAGLLPASAALPILELAGTSPHYRGLIRAAEQARPLPEALLNALETDFPETADVPAMAAAMIALDQTHDHLKSFADARWQKLSRHPDLDPAHEALLLQEHFTELLRTEGADEQLTPFRAWLEDSKLAAFELASALADWSGHPAAPSPPVELQQLLARITANCTACHRAFRDSPPK